MCGKCAGSYGLLGGSRFPAEPQAVVYAVGSVVARPTKRFRQCGIPSKTKYYPQFSFPKAKPEYQMRTWTGLGVLYFCVNYFDENLTP